MLKTLIKHEWKSVSKVGILLSLAMVVLTFLGWLAFQTPMWKSMYSDEMAGFSMHFADIMSILILLTYFLAIIAISYGFIIYVAIHMYRKMYSDQGYLTHTLPVSAHQLVGSKILVNGIWYLIIDILMLISMFVVVVSLLFTVFKGLDVDFSALPWNEIKEGIAMVEAEMGFNLGRFLLTMILLMVISPFTMVATVMGCISLGQLAKSNKGLMGFVWYIAVNMIISIIAYIVQMISYVGVMDELLAGSSYMNLDSFYMASIDSTMVLTAIASVILYFVAVWINKKKINLV